MFFFDIQPEPREARNHIATCALAVVRQEAERNVTLAEFANEPVRTRYEFRPAIQNAVHVDEEPELQRCVLQRYFSSLTK
jgi:hypothetical protein